MKAPFVIEGSWLTRTTDAGAAPNGQGTGGPDFGPVLCRWRPSHGFGRHVRWQTNHALVIVPARWMPDEVAASLVYTDFRSGFHGWFRTE